MTINVTMIYSVLYVILLVQGVVVLGFVIGILLDVKKVMSSVAELGESLSDSGKKVHSLVSDFESRIRSLATVGGVIAILKESIMPLVKGEKRHKKEDSSASSKVRKKVKIT